MEDSKDVKCKNCNAIIFRPDRKKIELCCIDCEEEFKNERTEIHNQ